MSNSERLTLTATREQDRGVLEALVKLGTVSKFEKKAFIFKAGDVADGLYYVLSGSLSVLADTDDEPHAEEVEAPAKKGKRKRKHRSLVLGHLQAGDFVGEIGLFYPSEKRTVTLQAQEDAVVAKIPLAALKSSWNSTLQPYSERLLFLMAAQMSKRLLETTRKAGRLAQLDVQARIERALWDLTMEPQAMTHPDGMQIKVSRQELARMVGCSREMAGRALKILMDQKKIWAKGKTVVVFGARGQTPTIHPIRWTQDMIQKLQH